MELDYYINWDLAREFLQDLHEVTIEAMRLTDVIRLKGEYIHPSDQLLTSLLQAIDLEDEQVKQISRQYLSLAASIGKLADQLGTGEIEDRKSVV